VPEGTVLGAKSELLYRAYGPSKLPRTLSTSKNAKRTDGGRLSTGEKSLCRECLLKNSVAISANGTANCCLLRKLDVGGYVAVFSTSAEIQAFKSTTTCTNQLDTAAFGSFLCLLVSSNSTSSCSQLYLDSTFEGSQSSFMTPEWVKPCYLGNSWQELEYGDYSVYVTSQFED